MPQAPRRLWLASRLAALASLALSTACAHPVVAPPEPDLAGYYDGSRFEMFAGLRLSKDHTFEFALSVGALDLRSSGTWQSQGNSVLFTTSPEPVPPMFELAGPSAESDAPLVTVTWPNGEPIQNIRVDLVCADGSIVTGFTSPEGWSPAESECDSPKSLKLHEEIYDIASRAFALKPDAGASTPRLHFILQPNDLGVLDLTDARGAVIDGRLELETSKGRLEFRKVPAN